MTNRIYTISEARKQFKEIGYKLKINRYSDFSALDIIHIESKQKLGISIVTTHFRKEHEKAYQLRESLKGKIFEDTRKIII